MKKTALAIVAILASLPALAKGPEVKVSPGISIVGKIDDVRTGNFAYEGSLNYFLTDKFGASVTLFGTPLESLGTQAFSIGVLLGSIVKIPVAESIFVTSSFGLGSYHTTSPLTHENAFGFNFKTGVEHEVKKALIGFHISTHYISNVDVEDDAVVAHFGPTFGFRF